MKEKKVQSRVGLQASDIFASTTRVQPISKPSKSSSKQIQHSPIIVEKYEATVQDISKKSIPNAVKSTVTFDNKHVVFLDRLSSNIRANSMAIVDRGAIIRALISAVEESQIDVSHAQSEEQIKDLLCLKLQLK